MNKFRTQFMEKKDVALGSFEPSQVQPGMSPSISQMVRTRSVGGNIEELEMDGIAEDAPFDSEYLDFFEMQDMARDAARDAAAEREAAEQNSPNGEAPPKTDIPERDHAPGDSDEAEK